MLTSDRSILDPAGPLDRLHRDLRTGVRTITGADLPLARTNEA